jgi:predicted ATPase
VKHTPTLAALARYVLRPCMWDANADAWSRTLPSDSPGNIGDALKEDVISGAAKMAQVEDNGRVVGYIIFTATERHELLVCAAYGVQATGERVNYLPNACRILDGLARQCECSTIRFHTMRPGMIRAAMEDGFRVSEVIMRRDVR